MIKPEYPLGPPTGLSARTILLIRATSEEAWQWLCHDMTEAEANECHYNKGANSLSALMIWDSTPQGHKFWYDLYFRGE